MKASIISIGDELLIGKTVNTNATFLGDQLEQLGIQVIEVLTISDDKPAITEALNRTFSQSDIILMTGGLGPTRDDITKKVLAEFFGTKLVRDERQLQRIRDYFEKRGRILNEINEFVADIPENALPIDNDKGTAAGMWFESEGRILVSMPGVPNEMRSMMHDRILPKLRTELSLPIIIHEHLHTAGIGESMLSEILEDLEDNLPEYIKLAYLPSIGTVKLRLTARGTDKEKLHNEIENWSKRFVERLGKYYFGRDNDSLESVLGDILKEKGEWLATAESCTGGNIAHRITEIPGSSAFFKGTVVCYANEIKMKLLGVSEETLKEFGAVSEETVRQMVKGIIELMDVDYAIATSGIAGPGGGTPTKPVGTVWIAVGNKEHVRAKMFHFPMGRIEHIDFTSSTGLEMLRRFILRSRGQLE